MRWTAALMMAATLGVTACDRGPSLAPDPPELVIEERAPGNGEPAKEGDHVAYWYTVRLLGTTEAIDSNVGTKLYEVDIGQHKVIAGMEQGLTGMRAAQRRCWCRSAWTQCRQPPILPPYRRSTSSGDGDMRPPSRYQEPPPAAAGL